MRMELWKNADASNILANKGHVSDPLPQHKNRTTRNTIPLEAWSLVIEVSRPILHDHSADSANVLDELAGSFPDLVIQRYLSFNVDIYDILLIQQPQNYSCQAWETLLTALSLHLPRHGMPFQLSGDINAFWGKSKPEGYSTDTPLAFPSVLEFLPGLPQKIAAAVAGPTPLNSPWLAIDSVDNQDRIPGEDGEPFCPTICLSCKIPHLKLLEAPGATLCCQPCLDRIFYSCLFCINYVHKAESVQLPCEHRCCKDCLNHCFTSATTNLSSFPPQCCKIALKPHSYRELLADDTLKRYIELQQQQDLSKNITRGTPTCKNHSIPHIQIDGEWALCEVCLQLTCIRCGSVKAEHLSTPGEGPQCKLKDDEINAYAKRHGWKQCKGCRHMVERTQGCNHMTCRCGRQFCYRCGADYKNGARTCTCRLHEELQLPGEAPVPAQVQRDEHDPARPVAAVMAECVHDLQAGRSRDDRCHGCLSQGRQFRRCRTCRVVLCTTCAP